MKLFIALFAVCLLAGCTSPQEKARKEAEKQAQINAADNATCQRYGFVTGTAEYAQCRLTIDQNRASQAAAQRQMILNQYIQQQGIFKPAY